MGLLKGIDPLLTADLLWVLRSMGHGDKIAIVDCNFPAYEVSKKTTSGKLIQLPVDLPTAVEAVCSVLPLDLFVENPAEIMSPSKGLELPPSGEEVWSESSGIIHKHSGISMSNLERFRFYEKARTCFAVIQTMERRPYGNVILQKGVIGPDGNDLKP
jgi:L-fucose mutarotase